VPQLTFEQARTILQSRIADSSNPTADDQALNQAQREVARARRWPELVVRAFLNTEAAYSTGTVATDGTTSVTLTSGTWPTTVASSKFRFALSTSDPWYEVATRSSASIILLNAAYVDDDQTAASYIVYKSHYSLASAVDRVEEMWLHDAGRHVPLHSAATDQHVTEFLHYPSGPGVPTHFYNMERDASGNRQILLGPNTPDDVYRIEYTYKKKTTDGTLSLDETRWPVILSRATAIRYEPEFYERSLVEMQRYEKLLADEWAREGETEIQEVRVADTRFRYPTRRGYYNDMMGFGRVSDPT